MELTYRNKYLKYKLKYLKIKSSEETVDYSNFLANEKDIVLIDDQIYHKP